jgi:GDPmannose 4,6-dehydratase
MWKILQQKKPEDYILATDETHSVKEFAKIAFEVVELDWKKYVKTDKKLLRLVDVNSLKGDYRKAKKELQWKPKTKFKKLVEIMVKEDLERWQKWEKGESFPWDASNYTNENKMLFRRYNKI